MEKKTKKHFLICSILGVISGFCNGLFGSGGGTIVVPFLEDFLKLNPKRAHATAILIIFIFTLILIIVIFFI